LKYEFTVNFFLTLQLVC